MSLRHNLKLLSRKLTQVFWLRMPSLFVLAFASVAHAQGTIDFSGSQTLMGTFKTILRILTQAGGWHHGIATVAVQALTQPESPEILEVTGGELVTADSPIWITWSARLSLPHSGGWFQRLAGV